MSILCKILHRPDNPLNFYPEALAHFSPSNKARVKGRRFKQLISHQFIVIATCNALGYHQQGQPMLHQSPLNQYLLNHYLQTLHVKKENQ